MAPDVINLLNSNAIYTDVTAEGSLLVTHKERIIELTGAAANTTVIGKSWELVVPSFM